MKKQERIEATMKNLAKYYDYRERTTLNRMRKNPDPYKVLIACLLSLRARDENTDRVSKKLFAIADTPQKIVKIPQKKLEKIIFSLGHYRKKAQTIRHVSKITLEKYGGKVTDKKKKQLIEKELVQ